jgi:ribose transport system substrate-binding protein
MRKTGVFMIVIALAFAITGVAFGGGSTEKAAAGKTFTIGYSQFWGTNPFLIAMTNGANKAIEEWKAKGVQAKLIVTNGGDTDPSKQVADAEDLFSQKVNGLLIFPGDSTLLSEPIKNLYNKNNVPVVVTDIGLQSGSFVSFLITDNYLGGKQLADLAAKNVKKGAKVVTFQHSIGNLNSRARQAGFEDRAKELGLKVIPARKPKLSLEDGKTTMEDTLASDPDIAAAFFINQVVAQGAVSALEAAGNTTCKVLTFDIDKPSLELVKSGKILGCTVQDPWLIGHDGMNQMLLYLTGGATKQKIDIPPKLCTKENASDFDNDPQVTGL